MLRTNARLAGWRFGVRSTIAAIGGELKTESENALKALTATPPDPIAATKTLWTALGATDALFAAKCLPAPT